MDSRSVFDTLPDELVIEILQHLPLKDVLRCRQVSLRFANIGVDGSILQPLCQKMFGCKAHRSTTSHWLNHIRIINSFVKRYKNLSNVDILTGNSVLHVEIASKRIWDKDVETLIDHGLPLSARNYNGDTPLHIAIRKNDKSTIEKLLKHKADVNAMNHLSIQPIHLAAQLGNTDILQLLLLEQSGQSSSSTTTTTKSLSNNDNSLAIMKTSPLHTACKHGHIEIIDYLLKHQLVPLNSVDETKSTPLHYAVSYAKFSVIRLLVDLGANIEARDNNDKTPLDIASSMGLSYAINLFNVVQMWTQQTFSHYLPSGSPLHEEDQICSSSSSSCSSFSFADWNPF